ncbi:hypothetical protein [Streptomyces sp. NPDC055692]|uniref:hypothetical protein n=1 Tax=Streptomyces sp. NPDC055692 TaxID=3155683 RepID=UPI00343152BF
MAKTLIPLARPYAPDSPLAHLLDMAHAADIPSADGQREEAETAAAHHIYEQYTDTLGKVIEACDWSGYPALRSDGFRSHEPSAVVWLDGGLWLHHTLHISEDGARNVLTLITPCTCGRGYVDVLIENETDLLAILADLRPTGGRTPHGDAGPYGCGSTQSLASPSPWR